MKKLLKKQVVLFLAVAILLLCLPSKVYAGEINSAESRVLGAMSMVVSYDGYLWGVSGSAINAAAQYFAKDGVNLSDGEADGMISQFTSSPEAAVNSGYMVKIGPDPNAPKKPEPKDDKDKKDDKDAKDLSASAKTDKVSSTEGDLKDSDSISANALSSNTVSDNANNQTVSANEVPKILTVGLSENDTVSSDELSSNALPIKSNVESSNTIQKFLIPAIVVLVAILVAVIFLVKPKKAV